MRMHADQVEVPDELVRHLLDTQFPQWCELPLSRLPPMGTDHQLFRLGTELLVRMPIYRASADQAESDARWLPSLAGHLPVSIPVPVVVGAPGRGYPFAWSVVPWLPGENPGDGNVDPERLAGDLAEVVLALHEVDTTGGPAKTGSSRGAPLGPDPRVPAAIARLGDLIDGRAALAVWEAALEAGPWPREPTWIHGDLLPGNLLVQEGRLSALIDFGALGVGDPSADLTAAWTTFDGRSRRIFHERLAFDDAAWARARARAMLPALTGLTYYADTVPEFADRSRRHIRAVLTDPRGDGLV
jgi:aminoglycoside phosphotransferase (APT) family kinase protein